LKRYQAQDISFYITNVCNLTCNHCESFNNFAFKGHYRWKDYQEVFRKWSEILSIEMINIHGGEPITNPDIVNWAIGIKELWPDADEYYVSSNGTLLKHKIETTRQLVNLGYNIDIVIHDPEHRQPVLDSIHKILEHHDYIIDDEADPVKNRHEYIDKHTGQNLMSIEEAFVFRQNSINEIKDRVIHMHRSDPVEAHRICFNDVDEQCWGFFKGRLYKCYLTGIAEDLVKQFDIEPEAKELLLKYKPGWPYDDEKTLDNFFENLPNHLEQCTLCPDFENCSNIFPMPNKKVKI